MEEQRELAEKLEMELEKAEAELAHIGEEANGKIQDANRRIRILRQERGEVCSRDLRLKIN